MAFRFHSVVPALLLFVRSSRSCRWADAADAVLPLLSWLTNLFCYPFETVFSRMGGVAIRMYIHIYIY